MTEEGGIRSKFPLRGLTVGPTDHGGLRGVGLSIVFLFIVCSLSWSIIQKLYRILTGFIAVSRRVSMIELFVQNLIDIIIDGVFIAIIYKMYKEGRWQTLYIGVYIATRLLLGLFRMLFFNKYYSM